ncbi:ROK family protein [Nocardioides zhouii]|uniref:ROK family protein n=1 Tax=Nocardioides zhouii TaxID=1168729 RepID=A0A4Q2SIZ2_9ACTN|nr:ROK family protein [Nocardioides zhouii]RYC03838.1 ROK family protein [Nocardioides zhouii]
MSIASDRFLGVDLGGTGTRIVLADASGTVLADRSVATATDPRAAVVDLGDALAEVASGPVAAIGIGASGPIDRDGVIRNPDTLPAYTGADLVGALRDRFAAPVVIDNDAVTAAHAEARLGAGRGARSLLMVTLGTGVGVAMLSDGVPLRTAAGTHPEAGHLGVPGGAPCYCGRSSCWEQSASRSALEAGAARLGLDLDAAAGVARAGDPAATDLFAAYGEAVGTGLVDLLTLLGPDRVVLGGGGARFLDCFRESLDDVLGRVVGCYDRPSVVPATVGNLAGALGAALLGTTASRVLRVR